MSWINSFASIASILSFFNSIRNKIFGKNKDIKNKKNELIVYCTEFHTVSNAFINNISKVKKGRKINGIFEPMITVLYDYNKYEYYFSKYLSSDIRNISSMLINKLLLDDAIDDFTKTEIINMLLEIDKNLYEVIAKINKL